MVVFGEARFNRLDAVAVWGRQQVAHRERLIGVSRGSPKLETEVVVFCDGYLRSIRANRFTRNKRLTQLEHDRPELGGKLLVLLGGVAAPIGLAVHAKFFAHQG